MHDLKLANAPFGCHVNATSPDGVITVFHALFAVNNGVSIRALMNSGTSHCYINSAILDNQLRGHSSQVSRQLSLS